MYRNRKLTKGSKTLNVGRKENKRALNTIDENASIKIQRLNDPSDQSRESQITSLNEMQGSEENIPASQELTQRYLSQRSTAAATLARTQTRINSSQRPPNTYFELALMKAGALLDEGDSFVLSCDHVAFVSRLRDLFERNHNFEDHVKMFKTGLRDAWSRFAFKLLGGCTISVAGEDSVYQSQDSMIVNFFMIDFLREHVLLLLLEKIDQAACGDTFQHASTPHSIPLLPLMLAQLRYVTLTHGALVYEHIERTFEKANQSGKRDIISSAELILNPSDHDKFAQMLIDGMANSKELFQSATIQTLTNLSLSSRMQERLRCKILAYIKEDDQCSWATLPLLVQFLLKVLTEDTDDSVCELVATLRVILSSVPSTVLANRKQVQVQLFAYIEQGLIRSKKFYSAWQKTIATLPTTQFKAIDFVMLLLLIHIKEDNSFYIENMLRRHTKLLPTSLIGEIHDKYAAVLELHWNTLMEVLNLFLRDKHKAVVEFARRSYGSFFDISESVQKHILKKLLELTCERSPQKNTTNFALRMLKDLWNLYPKILCNWGMLLLPFLDHLSELTLSQTRLVMELLSAIAFPSPKVEECTALQDQIDMVVKKQIINRNAFVRKQGIIGSVQLIDCIARIEENDIGFDDFETSFNTVNDLPDGRGKMAAHYVVRMQSSTIHSPDFLALFYDELSSVCAAGNADRANGLFLDKPFMFWLCDMMTYYFQNSFVHEHAPETICGVPLSFMKCINSSEDVSAEDRQSELPSIAINIAELVLKPSFDATSSVLVLSPLFKLVCALHMQCYKGTLEVINALLGCAIVLPTFFDDEKSDAVFYDYDEAMQKKILDIYFHCVNWIRETVSSFSTQREEMIRRKVLQRLTELIQVEDKVRHLLLKAPPDYMPPMCHFATCGSATVMASKIAGRGRPNAASVVRGGPGKAKSKALLNESEPRNLNNTSLNQSTGPGDNRVTEKLLPASKAKTSNSKYNFDNLYGPKELYRQMDINIMLILNEKLCVKYPLPPDSVGVHLGLLEFRFILTDLMGKLESILDTEKLQSDQSLQYVAKPSYFMNDLSSFIGIIGDNMRAISDAITGHLDEVKHVYSHADLFDDGFNLLKVCFGLCLQLLVAYFSWPDWFVNEESQQNLKKSLLVFVERAKVQCVRNKTISSVASESFSCLMAYECAIVDLKSAVSLYQLLVVISKLSDEEKHQQQAQDIRSLCRTFLCRKWFGYDGALAKGATCNVHLDELVKGFLCDSDFRRQHEILLIIRKESKQLIAKDSSLKSFPNIKKANFPLFFRGLCETLITSLSNTLNANSAECSDRLKVWESSCELLNMLLEIVKSVDVPRNFQMFLKYSLLYLKLLLEHGLAVFEQHLRQNVERVSDLLKSLQITTRFLHNLCCHSKALKNTAIVSQIPLLRETVENFVFRVKALLAANKCASAFFMGNLRNKDLHGEELLSQSASLSTAPDQDSDEEIPEDDTTVDETVLGANETARNESDNSERRSKSSSRSKCF